MTDPKIDPKVDPASKAETPKGEDPDQTWIAYTDKDGETHRVTSQEYVRRGL